MTFHSRPPKSPVGIPSPIWPKYVGDDVSSGKNVQIMKERFGQQRRITSDEGHQNILTPRDTVTDDGHQNIVTWLQGITLRRDILQIMITVIATLFKNPSLFSINV